jgi:hypothetical protein
MKLNDLLLETMRTFYLKITFDTKDGKSNRFYAEDLFRHFDAKVKGAMVDFVFIEDGSKYDGAYLSFCKFCTILSHDAPNIKVVTAIFKDALPSQHKDSIHCQYIDHATFKRAEGYHFLKGLSESIDHSRHWRFYVRFDGTKDEWKQLGFRIEEVYGMTLFQKMTVKSGPMKGYYCVYADEAPHRDPLPLEHAVKYESQSSKIKIEIIDEDEWEKAEGHAFLYDLHDDAK